MKPNGESLNIVPLYQKKASMSTLPSSIQYCMRSSGQLNEVRTNIKDTQIGNKEVKQPLFIDNINLNRRAYGIYQKNYNK